MTDRDLNELSAKQIVVNGPMHFNDGWAFLGGDPVQFHSIDPFVAEMHTKNGLLDDCRNSDVSILFADYQMVEWIKQYTSGDHIPLAGSGVSHFDRAFIKKDLPKFDKYLSYWAYDVGVIRRTLKLFGIDASRADLTEEKDHRALGDIRTHVQEMRVYKEIFTRWDDAGLLQAVRSGWPG